MPLPHYYICWSIMALTFGLDKTNILFRLSVTIRTYLFYFKGNWNSPVFYEKRFIILVIEINDLYLH